MAILGVIGGLGPMATVYFARLVIEMTDASTDQEHLKTIIYSAPDIPDRTEYILGRSDKSPVPGIIEVGLALKNAGAEVLAIPCVTAHCFHHQIESAIGAKTLNALEETAKVLQSAGIRRVGLAATEGTVQSGVFQRVFEAHGIKVITPSGEGQARVNDLIYKQIKKTLPPDPALFFAVKKELAERGAEAMVLGCTELSLIKRDIDVGKGVVDVSEVLARAAVLACGKPLRREYAKLLSGRLNG